MTPHKMNDLIRDLRTYAPIAESNKAVFNLKMRSIIFEIISDTRLEVLKEEEIRMNRALNQTKGEISYVTRQDSGANQPGDRGPVQ